MTTATLLILVVLFVWSFAEAYVWPIVPDAALAVVVFAHPETAVWGTAIVVVGSAVGGVTGIVARRRGWRWPLPLVTDPMRDRVRTWLDAGALGLRHQPLTAVPYKAFVVEAARRGVSVVGFASATLLFRGLRMAGIASLALLASNLVTRWSPSEAEGMVRIAVMGASLVVFLVGWRLTHRMWAPAPPSPDSSPSGTPTAEAHTMRP